MRSPKFFGWVACAVACAFLVTVLIGQGLGQASLWAGMVAALAGVVAVAPRPTRAPSGSVHELQDWMVPRPAEMSAVLDALLAAGTGTVGVTTGLHGVGGFGKTTLAQMVCADPAVRRSFGSRVFQVTMGRDVREPAAIAAKVNEVIRLVTDEDATFADPDLAGQRLGARLDSGPRRLLFIDDVWYLEQLKPLANGGRRCVRLVTTRVPGLLTGRGISVPVDQMSVDQARTLLTAGLPPLDPEILDGLLAVTGLWPLLLRLVNQILANVARNRQDVTPHARSLLDRLRERGPAAADGLLGEAGGSLDVNRPGERARAVRLTIEASTSLLDVHGDADRFAELAVFAEDEAISFDLVAMLWRATAGIDGLETAQVCARLADLALVSISASPGGTLTLHDVVRDFLRIELGPARLAELNRTLLDAFAGSLPTVVSIDPPTAGQPQVAWWELADDNHYLWDHLIEHLRDGDRHDEAERLVSDLRWVGARLRRFGPAAPLADLGMVSAPRVTRLRAALTQAAHLFSPAEPAHAVTDVMHSRIAANPDWSAQVSALKGVASRPSLVNRWPLPDLPNPALRQVLPTHGGRVWATAVAPDGKWLAAGGDDGKVRIWNAGTWQERVVLAGHAGGVRALAIAPDGSWLASGGEDRAIRVWDTETGRTRAILPRHAGAITAITVSPDGNWLATTSASMPRIWSTSTWRQREGLAAVRGSGFFKTHCLTASPAGDLLVAGDASGMVELWDASTWRSRLFTGHDGPVLAIAFAPHGRWFATGGNEGVMIWDTAVAAGAGGLKRRPMIATISDADSVEAVAVAPDGKWLAAGNEDGLTRIYRTSPWRKLGVLNGHSDQILSIAIAPDSSWLATASGDGTVRIWDTRTALSLPAPVGNVGAVTAIAAAPDDSWLATASRSRAARVRDSATGQTRMTLTAQAGAITAIAISMDKDWIATGGDDGTARIWDSASGTPRTTLTGLGAITALAIAPNATWLAVWSHPGGMRVWNSDRMRPRRIASRPASAVTAVAVSPDGTWLAALATDGTIRIWDTALWLRRMGGPKMTGTTSLCLAPDGTWLATGTDNGSITIWGARTWDELVKFSSQGSHITALAASPDGMWLLATSRDGIAQVWDTSTWQPQALMRVDNAIYSCAWLSPTAITIAGAAGPYAFDLITGPQRA